MKKQVRQVKAPDITITGTGRNRKVTVPLVPFPKAAPKINVEELLRRYHTKLETYEPRFVPKGDEEHNYYHVNSYIVGFHWRRRPVRHRQAMKKS